MTKRMGMARRGWMIAVLLGGFAAAVPGSAAVPLAAFGHLPTVDQIALSPDGTKVALIVGGDNGRQLQVRAVAGHAMLKVATVSRTKIRALQWAGGNHLLITQSTTAEVLGLSGPKREYLLVSDLNVTTGKMTALLNGGVDNKTEKLNTIVGEPMVRTVKGRVIAYLPGVTFVSSQGVVTLFSVDLDSHRTSQIAVGNTDTDEFLVDAGGVLVARVDYAQRSGRWTLFTGLGGRLNKTMEDVHPVDSPWLAGFGRTPGMVMVGLHDDDDTAFGEIALGSDTAPAVVPVLANGSLITDPATGVTIGSSRHSDLGVDYHFLDPADTALWAKVARGFGTAVVQLESWSDDRKTMILKVEGQKFGAAYYLLDVATRHAAWLVDEYAAIQPDDLGEKRSLHYAAADGTDIPAYLTLPPGVTTAKGLPLVVLPHGGPGARDDPGFDWWAQALASRGYAVLQPQFRGSTGFGGHFHAAGYGEWGRKMQTDLSDGVAFLAKAGTIDARRVCIVGASYGGYAALAGVTLQHGIYRCAVSLAGPSDLRLMLDYERTFTGGLKNRTLRHWQRFMGAKSPSDPALDAISPVKFAATADAPVLLLHGVDDTVVAIDQSKAMAAALKRGGKPVEFVTLPGEDHWLSRSETRAAMLDATVAFLGRHLPVDAPAAKVAAAAP